MFKTDVGLKCLHVTTVIIYCMKIFHTKAYTDPMETKHEIKKQQLYKSYTNTCNSARLLKKCGGDF